jgi:DNA-binding LacI/PurR family transcriptional regulator
MGYKPDPALRALCAYRVNRSTQPSDRDYAAAVLVDFPRALVRGNFLPDLVFRTEDVLRSLGYVTHRFDYKEYGRPQQLAKVMLSRGVRGLVVFAIHHPELAQEFPWESFSVMLHSQPLFAPPLHMVREDRFGTVARAIALVRARGYRRPGLAMLSNVHSQHLVWETGAWLSNHRDGQTPIPPLHMTSPDDTESLRAWLDRHQPDVVLGDNSVFHRILVAMGYRLPEDFAFLCLLRHAGENHLAGFDTSVLATSDTLARQLDLLVRHGELGPPANPLSMLVSQNFVDGPTLPQQAPPEPAPAAVRRKRTAAR